LKEAQAAKAKELAKAAQEATTQANSQALIWEKAAGVPVEGPMFSRDGVGEDGQTSSPSISSSSQSSLPHLPLAALDNVATFIMGTTNMPKQPWVNWWTRVRDHQRCIETSRYAYLRGIKISSTSCISSVVSPPSCSSRCLHRCLRRRRRRRP
jgi:hypothetical protein